MVSSLRVLFAVSLQLLLAPLVVAAPGEGGAQAPVRTPAQVIEESSAAEWRTPDPETTLYVDLEGGRVIIELAPDFAPRHVAQVKALSREGFYDGLTFYRVIEGFVAQAGDLDGDRLVRGVKRQVAAEFERDDDPNLPFTPLGAPDGYAAETGFVKGFPAARDPAAGRMWLVHCPRAVAMARDNDPDSGGTEIYVVLGHAPRYLDRNLSVFGRVLEGQELLQALTRGAPGSGMIEDEAARGRILRARVAADIEPERQERIEVLRTDSDSFAALIAARRHRAEDFFVYHAEHIDVCGVPVPVRRAALDE